MSFQISPLRASIPADWPRACAIDFGRKNFFAIFCAYSAKHDRWFLYASYKNSGHSNTDRAIEIREFEPNLAWTVAGQRSETYERDELAKGGIYARTPPYHDLRTGINNFYAGIKLNKFALLEDACPEMENEFREYSRPVDENGVADEDAEPLHKSKYHYMDCGRYFASIAFQSLSSLDVIRAGGKRASTQTTREVGALSPVRAASSKNEQESSFQMRAGSNYGRMRAQRYGLDAGAREPHLDLDLN